MIARRVPILALAVLVTACGGMGAASECGVLALRAGDGEVEVQFSVEEAADWRVVVVHESHVAWRGTLRGPFTLTRRMKDYRGPDHVTVRASGPDGRVCTRSGKIAGW